MSDGGYELEAEAPTPAAPKPKTTLADAAAASRARAGAPLKITPLCPTCGYDLTGTRGGKCPECGRVVTESALRHAAAKRAMKWHERAWVVALLHFLAGLVLACGAGAWDGWRAGDSALFWAVVAAVGLGVTVVIACGVYFVCAMVWIGWSQSVPTTMLQVAGVFGLTIGVGGVLGLLPVPVLPWALSVLVLFGLMMKVLDLDVRDAVIVALLVNVARLLAGVVVTALLVG